MFDFGKIHCNNDGYFDTLILTMLYIGENTMPILMI
jgi:hypothetical protein